MAQKAKKGGPKGPKTGFGALFWGSWTHAKGGHEWGKICKHKLLARVKKRETTVKKEK